MTWLSVTQLTVTQLTLTQLTLTQLSWTTSIWNRDMLATVLHWSAVAARLVRARALAGTRWSMDSGLARLCRQAAWPRACRCQVTQRVPVTDLPVPTANQFTRPSVNFVLGG